MNIFLTENVDHAFTHSDGELGIPTGHSTVHNTVPHDGLTSLENLNNTRTLSHASNGIIAVQESDHSFGMTDQA